jgi:hypothetical protein
MANGGETQTRPRWVMLRDDESPATQAQHTTAMPTSQPSRAMARVSPSIATTSLSLTNPTTAMEFRGRVIGVLSVDGERRKGVPTARIYIHRPVKRGKISTTSSGRGSIRFGIRYEEGRKRMTTRDHISVSEVECAPCEFDQWAPPGSAMSAPWL